MQVGTILAWNTETQRGILSDSLSGQTYGFSYGHVADRKGFREGLRVTFDTAPTWNSIGSCSDRFVALNVESASGNFLRYAAQYTPE